jgi:hypothetical protein
LVKIALRRRAATFLQQKIYCSAIFFYLVSTRDKKQKQENSASVACENNGSHKGETDSSLLDGGLFHNAWQARSGTHRFFAFRSFFAILNMY